MANPFEIDTASYHVLINDEGQYSIWPEAIAIPKGWTSAFGPHPRLECLEYVEAKWTDLRPAKLLAR